MPMREFLDLAVSPSARADTSATPRQAASCSPNGRPSRGARSNRRPETAAGLGLERRPRGQPSVGAGGRVGCLLGDLGAEALLQVRDDGLVLGRQVFRKWSADDPMELTLKRRQQSRDPRGILRSTVPLLQNRLQLKIRQLRVDDVVVLVYCVCVCVCVCVLGMQSS